LQQPLNAASASNLDKWLQQQEQIAADSLLANVAGGRNAPDAAPGSVIASPSKEHPNYYFQWVRDAAITMQTVIGLYTRSGSTNSTIMDILNAYNDISYQLQHTSNPSGDFHDLSGLGEPKFMPDGSPFTGSWGRPQRDGPALRALTLMSYLKEVNETHPALWTSTEGLDFFKDLYDAAMPAHSTIKADLEYVSHTWHNPGFDLWEEIQGMHFFTTMVQWRALREGSLLAAAFNDLGASEWYAAQASHLAVFVPRFWNPVKGHIVEHLDNDRSGLDCGTLLGSLHGTVPNSTDAYAPWTDEVLVSMLHLVRDQRTRFPINATPTVPISVDGVEMETLSGVGVGRYPEDAYDGYEAHPGSGNPWFLCTSSVAEVLYRTARHLRETETLRITSTGLPFWETLLPDHFLVVRSYDAKSAVFKAAVSRLQIVGDGFLEVVKRHADGQGSLSEQFDRVNGFMRGATDLTWSYGAFLQAVWARERLS